MKNAIIEATKELLRVVLLSVLPILSSGLNPETGEIHINWNIVQVVALLALLRWADKYLHTLGKENNNNTLKRGITQF